MAKAKTIFEREFEITKLTKRDDYKLTGEDTHVEIVKLVAENIGVCQLTLTKLPAGLATGKKIILKIEDAQTKLEDHADRKPLVDKPKKKTDKK